MNRLKIRKLYILLILLFFILPVNASVLDLLDTTTQIINSGEVVVSGTKYTNPALNKHSVSKQKSAVSKPKKKSSKNITNKAPMTYEDYVNMSKDIKRSEFKIPEPKLEKDSKLVALPDPHFRVVKYNLPPGSKDIDLTALYKLRKADSPGVLSPDYSKMVYSSVFYYPAENQVTSEMYLINLDKSLTVLEKIRTANKVAEEITPLLSTDLSQLETESFKSLVLLDWSKDSTKLAVKEKVGSTIDGKWRTNLLVYDFKTSQVKELNEIREAIRYWWKTKQNLDLVDYMWDIYPVGWDAVNPDRLIVYAYAYTNSSPKFLGTWSVDYSGNHSELMSLSSTNFAISTNGLSLKAVGRE